MALTAALLGCAATPPVPKAAPTGEIKGTAWAHTLQSLAASVQNANVVLPAQATGGAAYSGKWSAMPASAQGKVPVVLFLHGSGERGSDGQAQTTAGLGNWLRANAGISRGQGVCTAGPPATCCASRLTASA